MTVNLPMSQTRFTHDQQSCLSFKQDPLPVHSHSEKLANEPQIVSAIRMIPYGWTARCANSVSTSHHHLDSTTTLEPKQSA